jgi:hypothetical protein
LSPFSFTFFLETFPAAENKGYSRGKFNFQPLVIWFQPLKVEFEPLEIRF